MLRFSKRENYATILISELYTDINKKFIPLSQIAQKHGISILFLRNIAFGREIVYITPYGPRNSTTTPLFTYS